MFSRRSIPSIVLVIAILLTCIQPCIAIQGAEPSSEDEVFILRLAEGWNLVSIPLIPDDNSVESIFSDIPSLQAQPVLTWKYNQFKTVGIVEPLTGYWVYSEYSARIEVHGARILNESKVLHPGWNMVGSHNGITPFNLSSIPNQVPECPPVCWNGTNFTEVQDLEPGQGAWVFVGQETVLTRSIYTPPGIVLLSPREDLYSNETVELSGYIENSDVDQIFLTQNYRETARIIPVFNQTFSIDLHLDLTNTIFLYFSENGQTVTETLVLDGDYLSEADEEALGFDPLDPDSDCPLTPENEAGNGILDGLEIFDTGLPVYAKVKAGADPFVSDSDGDGLTDYFELMKLGQLPAVEKDEHSVLASTFVNAGLGDYVGSASGPVDDPDSDGLTNIQEQDFGTDPFADDTDGDGILDPDEIQAGTNPFSEDSDQDRLPDDCELKLGTDPLNPDTDGDGCLDGDETYISSASFVNETLNISVFGLGYAVANFSVVEVNYSHLIDPDVLVSRVYDIVPREGNSSVTIRISYENVSGLAENRLSIYSFSEELGTFLPLSSVVDPANDTVSAEITNPSTCCVFDSDRWDALFEQPPGNLSREHLGDTDDATASTPEQHYGFPVKGVNYGVAEYYDTPARHSSVDSEPLLDGVSVAASKESGVSIGLFADSVSPLSDGQFQTVQNGDFFDGLLYWNPPGRDYLNAGRWGYEIDTYSGDYQSPPKSVLMYLWKKRLYSSDSTFLEYIISQFNVDMSYADNLTFKFKCLDSYGGSALGTSGFRVYIDDNQVYKNPPFPSVAYRTDWQTVTVPVSSYTGMKKVSFKAYLSFTSTSPDYSYVKYLIDDVSCWATEEEGTPTTSTIRFFVRDSTTQDGIESADVSSNNQQKTTSTEGYTPDFIFESKGACAYSAEKYGYNTKNKILLVGKGESRTDWIVLNPVSAPVGSISVTSEPSGAFVYIDNIFSRATPCTEPDLLAGCHNIRVVAGDYYPFDQQVEVKSGRITKVQALLCKDAGTIQIYSSPGEASVFIDDILKGETSYSGDLLLTGIAPGNHNVVVRKDGYESFNETVTVAKDQTSLVTAVLETADSEDDGLSDLEEVTGFTDGFGNRHVTDPYDEDTDGDGLSDGFEAGYTVAGGGKTYYKAFSDPNKIDTDDDGLDDLAEFEMGTDPFNTDTDGDGLTDYEDPNALEAEEDPFDISPLDIGRDLVLGAIFGETGLPDGCCNWLVGEESASSPFYIIGCILFSLLPIANAITAIRDAAQAIMNGDLFGAVLNSLDLLPGVGQIGIISGITTKYVRSFGWKAHQLWVVIAKSKIFPNFLHPHVWDVVYGAGKWVRFGDKWIVVTKESGVKVLKSIDGGREITIRNSKYAGDTYQGIYFDELGFPVFKNRGEVYLPKESFYKSYSAHRTESSKLLYEKVMQNPEKYDFTEEEILSLKDGVPPKDYVWHHHQDEGRMQLVKERDNNIGHTGGWSVWATKNGD